MEHLQNQAMRNPNCDVFAPQEVIDALVTLTRAGLLTWVKGRVRPTFELNPEEPLMLNHIQDEDEVAGYFMHITREQETAILNAMKTAETELAAVYAAAGQ
jgi:hypothetical protein